MSASGNPKSGDSFLFELENIIKDRKNSDPGVSYTSSLLNGDFNRILQKVGEESVEFILEAKGTNRQKIVSEGADLVFHFLVSLRALDLSMDDIIQELQRRHKK